MMTPTLDSGIELLRTLVVFFGLLILLVGVHEFGHFYIARRCGVKVLRFCIGMGTPMVSWYDKQGTEFALAPIPLGGYVKMLDESEQPVASHERHQAYNQKNVWQRIAILSAGPMANVILAILVFAILGLQGVVSLTPQVGKVISDSPAARAGLETDQEIVAVDGTLTATREAVAEQLLKRLGESGSLVIRVKYPSDDSLTYDLSIPLTDWLQQDEAPDPFTSLGFEFFHPAIQTTIGKIMPGGAAEKAGMLVGDQLIAVDDEIIVSWDQWLHKIQAAPGKPLKVELKRDAQSLQVALTPSPETVDGKTIGRIGVYPQQAAWPENMKRTRDLGPLQAINYGFEQSISTANMVLISIKKLLVGQISTKNLSGPIGIAKVAGDSAKAGLSYYFGFLAQLSVYLAVLNLLPIPVLDGGHILYCLIEAAKGSPVSDKLKTFSTQLGLLLLGGVMIVAFYNDLLRL